MVVMIEGTAHDAQLSKPRWGEIEEDDRDDLDFLLPPKEVIGPDENDVKKVIEYKFNEEGKKVKITTTVRTRKLAKAQISKQVVEHCSWAKLGDAVNGNNSESRTLVSNEKIQIERLKAPGMVSVEFYEQHDEQYENMV